MLKKKARPGEMVGITIQPSGVAMAMVQRDPGQVPRLLCHTFLPVDGSVDSKQWQSLTRTMQSGNVPANIVLGRDNFKLLMVEEPSVSEDEMRQAVRWKIKDMIDFSIDDAVVDVFSIPGQKERGRIPMVYAVAAKKDRVKNLIGEVEEANINLSYVDIPELVQRNVASLLEENEQGVALLYLGEHSGSITLTHQSVLYLSRDFEVGYKDLLPSDSSWVDNSVGEMSLEPGGIGQALLDTIVLEIQRSLDYYESHFVQAPIHHLYIAPLGEDITGLQAHMDANLGVQVHMLDLNTLLDCKDPISQQEQSKNFLAIGAALRESA